MQPFRDFELRSCIAATKEKMKEKVENYSDAEIMANNLELLADNLYEEFYIQPIEILEEEVSRRSVMPKKIKRQRYPFVRNYHEDEYVLVDGFIFAFSFPYTGEKDLFKCRASCFSISGYPEISIQNNFITFRYEKTQNEMKEKDAKDTVMSRLSRDLADIKHGIELVNNDVTAFNDELRHIALLALQARKKNVEAFFSLAAMFEVPVQKTEYATTHVPLQRKILPINHKYEEQPSFCISNSNYNEILAAIKHTCCTYERTPASYRSLQEEDLRNTLLATLNATYQGQATGETFRNNGKTDICIEQNNRAAFVAECKMWKGPAAIEKALKQLDSYLTWRDCKTALIYFVRNKEFLKITKTCKDTLCRLSVMRQVQEIDKNEFKCCMISEQTPGQLIEVRVLLFNLYSS